MVYKLLLLTLFTNGPTASKLSLAHGQ